MELELQAGAILLLDTIGRKAYYQIDGYIQHIDLTKLTALINDGIITKVRSVEGVEIYKATSLVKELVKEKEAEEYRQNAVARWLTT